MDLFYVIDRLFHVIMMNYVNYHKILDRREVSGISLRIETRCGFVFGK